MLRKIDLVGRGVVLFLFVIALPAVGEAGDYYVSPTGSAEWPACANIETPCSPKTAMSNAVAGDTVFFRGGTYNIPFTGWVFQQAELEPTHSGTVDSPITFINYPDEVPLLNCTGMPAWDNTDKKTQQAQILGNGFHEYIIYDGFHLQADGGERMASLIIFGSSGSNRARGIEVRNIDINGGSRNVTVDTNNDLLRIENTDGAIISNCKLYANRNVNSSEDDTCAIKMYHNSNSLIEHNNISDCNTGIYLKSDNDDIEIRYNWVDHVVNSIRFINASGMESYRVNCHDNLLTNFSNSANWVDHSSGYYNNDYSFYNNTLYSSDAVIGFAIGDVAQGFKFYNNIIQVNASTTLFRTRAATLIEQCDHNQWGSYTFNLQIGIWSETYYRTLSSWQVSKELSGGGAPGIGSLNSDPLFENGSGLFNQVNDFVLAQESPCKGAGRNNIDMGANIEFVGIEGGGGANSNVRPMQVKDFIIIQN